MPLIQQLKISSTRNAVTNIIKIVHQNAKLNHKLTLGLLKMH